MDQKQPETTFTTTASDGEEQIPNESQAEVKMVKLKTNETLIALVEFSKEEGAEDDDYVTLHNPCRVIFDAFTNPGRTSIILSEWLPSQIVSEQVCYIYLSDIITMVDVNERFRKTYELTVVKKIQLEELIRNGELMSRSPESMSEEEEQEEQDDEFGKLLAEKLKKFRDGYN
jgi:hypothetical protein